MLRQELQSNFHRVNTYTKIDTGHLVGGQVYIRFAPGEGYDNGTTERVNQSTDRVITIFQLAFQDPTTEIFVLI